MFVKLEVAIKDIWNCRVSLVRLFLLILARNQHLRYYVFPMTMQPSRCVFV